MKKLVFLLMSFLLIGCASTQEVKKQSVIPEVTKNKSKPKSKVEIKPKAEEFPAHIKELIDVVKQMAIKKYWWEQGYYSGLFEFTVEVKHKGILTQIINKEIKNPTPPEQIKKLPAYIKKLVYAIQAYAKLEKSIMSFTVPHDNMTGLRELYAGIIKKGGVFDIAAENIKIKKVDLAIGKPSVKKKYDLPLHILTLIKYVKDMGTEHLWSWQGCKNDWINISNYVKNEKTGIMQDIVYMEARSTTPVTKLDPLPSHIKELIFTIQKAAKLFIQKQKENDCHKNIILSIDFNAQISKITVMCGYFDKAAYEEVDLQAKTMGIELPEKPQMSSPKNQCPEIRKIVE